MDVDLLLASLTAPHLMLTVTIPMLVAAPVLLASRRLWCSWSALPLVVGMLVVTVLTARWSHAPDGSLVGLHVLPVTPVALLLLWLPTIQAGPRRQALLAAGAAAALSWFSILLGDLVQSAHVGQDLFFIGGSGLFDTLLLSPAIALFGAVALRMAGKMDASIHSTRTHQHD